MELKVWVEGIQRIVCGVTLTTTCQDVVFALAHATGKVGRFTLIERWRNNERLLAPNENPLKILLKWGEYSNDVQFILQRSDQSKRDKSQNDNTNKNVEQNSITSDRGTREKLKESPKILLSETKQVDNVGIVKGVPQKPVLKNSPQKNKNDSLDLDVTLQFGEMGANFQSTEFNMADIRSSLHKKTNSFDGNRNFNPENLIDMLECKKNNCDPVVDLLTTIAPISSNGALVPPPYRDPPPPRSSPLQKIDNFTTKKFEIKEGLTSTTFFNNNDIIDSNENFFQTAQYKDLVQLIKFQTDKISSQQADLTKFDAEIVYLENKERDQMEQLDAINMEITKTDHILRQGNEQLQTLQYVEEENELVRQQEKTLKSEITLLRSKLANCETELLQCRNKIRLLMDDIQIEQRAINNRQKDNRQQVERSFMTEVEKIQSEIDQAIQNADTTNKTTENLKKEVVLIENAIAEKKRQVEQLVNEMKEVNLQSLAVAPSDEIKHLLEGSNRPGSTRRIIGSPRQLENAVPTSKNPHGVWV